MTHRTGLVLQQLTALNKNLPNLIRLIVVPILLRLTFLGAVHIRDRHLCSDSLRLAHYNLATDHSKVTTTGQV